MKELVVVMAQEDFAQLGALRTLPHLMAATQGDRIWLRGIAVDMAHDPQILKLSAIARYMLGEDQLLFLPGAVTPQAYLPKLAWQPLLAIISLEMPVAAYGGAVEENFTIALVSSTDEKAALALVCRLDALQNWADDVSAARIEPLLYAVAADGDVIVLGDPLPAIPGKTLWDCDGLWVPSGFALTHRVLAKTIVRLLDPETKHHLLLHPDGSYERIPKSNFLQATRSGIRQTTIDP